MTDFKPHWFGDYELLQLLGVGGMAEVYLARTIGAQGFEKTVVVKRLLPRLVQVPRFVQMFIDEAKVAVRLQHANIVQILSLDEYKQRPFIVMEHVHGKDLNAVLRRVFSDKVALPVDFAIHCIAEMLKGLSYAHTACGADGQRLQLVHRDVTPSNIFISYEGEVKLGDFGVAHSVGEAGAVEVRGKMGYLAPEALYGGALDARADIFAAGVVLWEALTQRRLFHGKSDVEILTQVRDRVPEQVSTHNDKVPPDLDAICSQALEKDPKKRFQTALEFEEALSDYLFARRLRWTRRRIGDVMQARYADECQPLCLPAPSSKSETSGGEQLLDYVEATTNRVVCAMDGLAHTPEHAPDGGDNQGGWLDTMDEPEVGINAIDRLVHTQARKRAKSELFLVYLPGRESAVEMKVTELFGKLAAQPESVAGVGVVGEQRLSVADLGRTLYWDSLYQPREPDAPPAASSGLGLVSLTRLLYDLTVRRITGLCVVEGGGSRCLLYLKKGYPLYITSDNPLDGAAAVMRRKRLLQSSILYHGIAQSIASGVPLEKALVAVAGEENQTRIERIFSAVIRSRLYQAFRWHNGCFRVYSDVEPPVSLGMTIPPLLGILVRAVRKGFSLGDLQAHFSLQGRRAVIFNKGRQQHIKALQLKPLEQRVVDAVDGDRNVSQILQQAGICTEDEAHSAYATLYVIAQTNIAILV